MTRVPNAGTSEYFRNNMTMEIAAVVDMDQNLSVEAPGAQIQSIGSMKTVLFMVMPGEEQHLSWRSEAMTWSFPACCFSWLR